MVMPSEILQMERDFLSGKNPLAYLPLCQALRRQNNFSRALDLCLRGLAGDPDSVAGRTLHARLLADLGRYEEGLREIARVEPMAPDAMGLLGEKARILIRLRRLDEARAVLAILNRRNPLAPDVQVLNDALRQSERTQPRGTGSSSADAVPRIVRRSSAEILADLLKEMRSLVKIVGGAVIPLGVGDPAVEGRVEHAELALDYYRDVTAASRDLEIGRMRMGFLETEQVQLIVLVRGKALVAISFEPMANFGKVYHRFAFAVDRLLPESSAS